MVVDGELPLGLFGVPDVTPTARLPDGLLMAWERHVDFFLQHYTSLSVIHNYKEQHPNRMFDDANAPEYSMIVWKKV